MNAAAVGGCKPIASMPRQIETDPQRPSCAKWLAQAELVVRIVDELQRRGASRFEHAHRIKRDVGIELTLARRLERAYRFLHSDYPEVFETSKMLASWASALELSKLKAINVQLASEIAESVFAGRMTAPQIAALAKKEAQAPSRIGVFAEARALERVGPTFQQRVVALVREDPSVLQLGPVEDVFFPARGEVLMPDFILKKDGMTIAVEVKTVTPETSVSTIGSLLARAAQLEQRYTFAVLVFPLGSEGTAEMACSLQRKWDGREPHIVLL